MKYLFLIMILSAGSTAGAQHLSVGATAGADLWLHRPSFFQASGYNGSLGEGIFIRRDGKRRWSYEAALSHSSFKETREYYTGIMYDGPGSEFVRDEFSVHIYALALKADFRMSKKANTRLRQYAGFQLTPTSWMPSMKESVYDSATLQPVSGFPLLSHTGKNFRLWAGVQYTICYNLSSRLSIRAIAACQVEPIGLFDDELNYAFDFKTPHSKVSVDFGLAYRLH